MKACYYRFPLIEAKIKTSWITTFFMRKYPKYYLSSIFYVVRCLPRSVQEAKYWSLLTYSSTGSFGLPIPVSDLLIFCSKNLILHQKKKEIKMIKTEVLWWKTRKNAKKYIQKTKYLVFLFWTCFIDPWCNMLQTLEKGRNTKCYHFFRRRHSKNTYSRLHIAAVVL